MTHYLIIAVALIADLTSIGLNFTKLALVAGALSVGIGFRLQSVVNNFVSGLLLLFKRTLRVGDFIELDSGVRGTVREINVRNTLVNTSDNIDIIVANSELVSNKMINWTLRERFHRVHVPFGVAYGTDKDPVKQVALEAAGRIPFTILSNKFRAPDVWLVEFGDNSLNFELVVWINPGAITRPGKVIATYLWELETALTSNGTEIPVPQPDLHIRNHFESPSDKQASIEIS